MPANNSCFGQFHLHDNRPFIDMKSIDLLAYLSSDDYLFFIDFFHLHMAVRVMGRKTHHSD